MAVWYRPMGLRTPSSSRSLERFLEAARSLGLELEVRRFPEGTKTAEDAARAIGCSVGQIVKSLVFMVGDRAMIALTSGSNRVDPGRLAAAAGASSARRATPDEARAATGFAVGGTPPFGHLEPLRTFLDPDLLRYDEIWAAAGTPDGVFRTTPPELRTAARAVVVRFTTSGVDEGDRTRMPGTISSERRSIIPEGQ
jgi:prolyl-tRNA editing enzyme YbaK/EbsC (Cys-tRNA(Pro) deacylase)